MKALKIIAYLLGIFVLLLVAGGIYVKTALPDVGPSPVITVDRSPERVANGRYLANHVTVCMDCHSKRDWTQFAGPMTAGSLGGGGEVFNQQMGFPGAFYAPNITPVALSSWTDGDILRAVTTGVSKDGRALFPVMGWHRFGKMDRDDIYDIIAYLRTLPPIDKKIPASKADFPVNFLINTMPEKAQFGEKPNISDTVKYGAYLVNAAGCVECHSKTDKGNVIKGTEFGGGMEFPMPAGVVRSANITFHATTGLGSWSKAEFIDRFTKYVPGNNRPAALGANDMNTPMPWAMYGGMEENDLGAIYTYLSQLTPIDNKVIKFTPSKK